MSSVFTPEAITKLRELGVEFIREFEVTYGSQSPQLEEGQVVLVLGQQHAFVAVLHDERVAKAMSVREMPKLPDLSESVAAVEHRESPPRGRRLRRGRRYLFSDQSSVRHGEKTWPEARHRKGRSKR